jgi:hypothetical protein
MQCVPPHTHTSLGYEPRWQEAHELIYLPRLLSLAHPALHHRRVLGIR